MDTQVVGVDNQAVEDENHYVAVNIQVVEVAEVVEMLSPAVEVGSLLVVMVNYLSEENPFVEMVNFLVDEENLVAVEVENLIAVILNWVVVESQAAA
jgi:hypothetical protein